VAGEKLRAPVATVVFAPGVLWTAHDTPRVNRALLAQRTPRWLKQLQFLTADALFVRGLLGPQLNALRRELGLAPLRLIYSRWLFASDLVLGLFSKWFGPPQPDWPANTRVVGFPLWDSLADAPLPDEVCDFLSAGPPPIAFSPGSANRGAHAFFAAAVEACDRLGCRGILLTKYDHQLPSRLPDSVRHFGFVPLSKLLPHTAALVHHGGIGTCAQALAAGVPQVVQPMAYDQFDNSRRLMRLGVAAEISVKNFRGRTVALAAACDALEQLADANTAKKRE
jgi:UDP:flavonoid glycosyltransferase YjiC (YdhE family)